MTTSAVKASHSNNFNASSIGHDHEPVMNLMCHLANSGSPLASTTETFSSRKVQPNVRIVCFTNRVNVMPAEILLIRTALKLPSKRITRQ